MTLAQGYLSDGPILCFFRRRGMLLYEYWLSSAEKDP
jgi:hypothetical protein